jgi:spermidine/putrescine transport system substrate-binding protein
MKKGALILFCLLIFLPAQLAEAGINKKPLLKGVKISKTAMFIAVKSNEKAKLQVILKTSDTKPDYLLAKKITCKNNLNCLYQINFKNLKANKKIAVQSIYKNQPFRININKRDGLKHDYKRYYCQNNKRPNCILKSYLGQNGTLKISNWPLYVAESIIIGFEKTTAINIKNQEEVSSNEEFFDRIEANFLNGNSGQRSIIVLTDWMADKFNRLGMVQDLNQEQLNPAYNNLMPELKTVSIDPERSYSLPWQSNMTGLLIRTDLAPGIKSVNDLFDPKYKGKIAMSDQLHETVPLVMKGEGIDPVSATTEQWLATIEKIKQAKESGQIIGFSSELHVPALAGGYIVASIGLSSQGYAISRDTKIIKYIQPSQGCILWSDNILIPTYAPNVTAAYQFINYFYRPINQAKMTRYTNFVSPVPAAKNFLEKTNPGLAKSRLIFPTSQFINKCSPQSKPPSDQELVESAWRVAIG